MAMLLPTGRAKTPAQIAPRYLADAMAVMLVDLVGELPVKDRTATLERLANRFHARASTPNGSDAARLLGGVSAALMEMGL